MYWNRLQGRRHNQFQQRFAFVHCGHLTRLLPDADQVFTCQLTALVAPIRIQTVPVNDAQRPTTSVNKSTIDIYQYIAADQLPDFMNGTKRQPYNVCPIEAPTAQQWARKKFIDQTNFNKLKSFRAIHQSEDQVTFQWYGKSCSHQLFQLLNLKENRIRKNRKIRVKESKDR